MNPIPEGSAFILDHLPKSPHPGTTSLWIKISAYEHSNYRNNPSEITMVEKNENSPVNLF
jgi:hypothetical protein